MIFSIWDLRNIDYLAYANLSGLKPADVAILHREFTNLSRGDKLDRVVFRQLLREAVADINNEQIDRTIEDMFVRIDRNHDGWIDFPEFVGAFKEILKGNPHDPDSLLGQSIHLIGDGSSRRRSYPQLNPYQGAGMLSSGQQFNLPLTYGGTSAPISISGIGQSSPDLGQGQYIIAAPGQYTITQPTALQCIPLPMI